MSSLKFYTMMSQLHSRSLLSYPHVKLWILHHIHHWNFVLAADMHGLSFIYLFISLWKSWKINSIRGLTMDFPCWIQADTIFQFFRRKLKLLCQFEQRNELLAKFTSAMCFVFCPECFSSCCSLPCSLLSLRWLLLTAWIYSAWVTPAMCALC